MGDAKILFLGVQFAGLDLGNAVDNRDWKETDWRWS